MISRFSKAFLAIILALILLTSLFVLHTPARPYIDPWTGNVFREGGVELDVYKRPPAAKIHGVEGGVIMPKLGNETAKAALGQATWKLMHTMTLRFPEDPTQDEREALNSYFHLQARLYPCGECAAEFQQLLQRFPPQTSSRRTAALWLCYVHNQVNERLHKPEFDCAHLDDTYDCGCGDEPIGGAITTAEGARDDDPMDLETVENRDGLTGAGLIKGGR